MIENLCMLTLKRNQTTSLNVWYSLENFTLKVWLQISEQTWILNFDYNFCIYNMWDSDTLDFLPSLTMKIFCDFNLL